MFTDTEREIEDPQDAEASEGLSLSEFTSFFHEILQQPAWRSQADRENDYKDNNQLDNEILQKMAALGLPPAVENRIGLAIEAILGQEAKRRTDWRVIPDGDKSGQEVADAYNYKLNQAERKSRADRACSDAYESQVSVGLGWVEVSREPDPFKYPYRCTAIHRNELWWDWDDKSPMLDNARYQIRMRWINKDIAKLQFPDSADLLEHVVSGWPGFDAFSLDGGRATGLAMAANVERGWSIEEQQWRDVEHKKVRLFECWYRVWSNALIMKMPDGRVVEFDMDDPLHLQAITYGNIKPEYAVINKVRRSWWAGPHKLGDEPSPYRHHHFPYVPFWGHREDRTNVPFGRIRSMMYLQDCVNATVSKIRWGLSAVVTTRTDGAVVGSDEHFREEIARPDADVILDAAAMSQPGAQFKIERNFELNKQQYDMLNDARLAIQKIGGISEEFQGSSTDASQSGVAFSAKVEQSAQSLANIDDNFRESRAQVGELLLAMLIQDSIGKPEDVVIDGGALKDDKVINLNAKTVDEDGLEYLNNDVERTMLKVVLDEVPSTSSFRTQQLSALSEAYKASPPDYQRIIMPHMMALSDVPNKDDILAALKKADEQPSKDQQEIELKVKELDIKLRLAEAQIKQLEAQGVKTMVEAEYAAMQGAGQVVVQPAITPVADEILINAGYQQPQPAGQDPGFSEQNIQPAPIDANANAQAQAQAGQQALPTNLHPNMPVPPASPNMGAMGGIETARTTDNL
jgi:hypothetical protein